MSGTRESIFSSFLVLFGIGTRVAICSASTWFHTKKGRRSGFWSRDAAPSTMWRARFNEPSDRQDPFSFWLIQNAGLDFQGPDPRA